MDYKKTGGVNNVQSVALSSSLLRVIGKRRTQTHWDEPYTSKTLWKVVKWQRHVLIIYSIVVQAIFLQSWSLLPRGVRRWPTAVSQQGSRVRIPPGAWIYITCDCCVLWRYRSLRRADRSSRGTLPRVLCLTVCDRETSTVRRPRSE